jgi:hypothetical protein
VGVDRTLPGVEFLDRQLVSSADFLEAYHASAHRVDDYGFAPGHPAFCIGGRQVEVAIFRAGAMQRRRVFNIPATSITAAGPRLGLPAAFAGPCLVAAEYLRNEKFVGESPGPCNRLGL